MNPSYRSRVRHLRRSSLPNRLRHALLIAALTQPATVQAGDEDDGITPEGMAMMAQDAAGEQADGLEGRWRVLTVPDREGGGTAATRPNSVFTPGPGGEDGGGVCLLSFPDPSKSLWTVTSDHSGVQARRGAISVADGQGAAASLHGYVRSSFDLAGDYSSSAPVTWWVFLSSTSAGAGSQTATWLQLSMGPSGVLTGTRRYLGWNTIPQDNGGTAQVPCFYDFRVTASRLAAGDTTDRLRALGYQ